MGGVDFRRRSSDGAAAEDGECAPAISHARVPAGPAVVRGWNGCRCLGHRLGAVSDRQFLPDLRTAHCAGWVSRSSTLDTTEEDSLRKAIVTEKAPKPLG